MNENIKSIPLKLTKRGNFEGMTLKIQPIHTHQIIKFNAIFSNSMQFLESSRKNFTARSQKSRCLIILTYKWFILMINWFRNGLITVIFTSDLDFYKKVLNYPIPIPKLCQ